MIIPQWVQLASIGLLLLGLGCALYMAWQMKRNPPKMAVMRFVWPLCAPFVQAPAPRPCATFPSVKA